MLCSRLQLHATSQPSLSAWKSLSDRGEKVTLVTLLHTCTDVGLNQIKKENVEDAIRLAFVGKYTALEDAYASVFKAIDHAAMEMERRIEILLYTPLTLTLTGL